MKTTILLAILVASLTIVVVETSKTSESSKGGSLISVMTNVDEKGQISSRALPTWRDFLNPKKLLFGSPGDASLFIPFVLSMVMMPGFLLYDLVRTLVSTLLFGTKGSHSRSLHFLQTSPLVEDLAVIVEKVATALDNVDRKYN